jgi:hypothetical protein
MLYRSKGHACKASSRRIAKTERLTRKPCAHQPCGRERCERLPRHPRSASAFSRGLTRLRHRVVAACGGADAGREVRGRLAFVQGQGSSVDLSFAVSPLGAAYLAMLFVPNLLWARLRSRKADPAFGGVSPVRPKARTGRVGRVRPKMYFVADGFPSHDRKHSSPRVGNPRGRSGILEGSTHLLARVSAPCKAFVSRQFVHRAARRSLWLRKT